MTLQQSSAVHIQALVSADGILPGSSSKLRLLVINLASVPGRQLVNSPTAQRFERYALYFRRVQKFVYCTMNWQDHIVSDNQVLLGKPTIKGTRISVELVLELFSAGWTEKQILESYPTVSAESLRAVFAYLQVCIQQELYFPISA
jgi:uncharacterized protein (DUF433 family)